MVKVFDTTFATILMDLENQMLIQTWKGFAKVDEFKQAIDVSVSCFKNHSLSYILSDTTQQAVLAIEGSNYAAAVMPELIANGLKKIAFILPISSFTKLSVDNFYKKSGQANIGHFAGREEALAWLKE